MEALEKLRECVVYFDGDDCQGGNIVREVVKQVERLEGELIAARACAEMMLQGTGQKLGEEWARRVMDEHCPPRWIPVAERLPEVGVRVLGWWCKRGDDFKDVAYRHDPIIGNYWYRANGVEMLPPAYWMPLPEPPEVK